MDDLFTCFGYIASILTTLSFLPQAVKTIKEKNTDGISFLMYTMFTLGVFLWAIYGFFIKDLAILVGNALILLFSVIILSVKVKNMKNEKLLIKVGTLKE